MQLRTRLMAASTANTATGTLPPRIVLSTCVGSKTAIGLLRGASCNMALLYENFDPRRLLRYPPHPSVLSQTGRTRGRSLERSRRRRRRAGRAAAGNRGAGADSRTDQDHRRLAGTPSEIAADQPAQRLSA